MVDMSVSVAIEISCISRWPAVRFAVSRTPSAMGRINRLTVSIRISGIISMFGVPIGRRCPSEFVG